MRKSAALALSLLCLAMGCGLKPDPETALAGRWELDHMAGWYEFDLPGTKGGPTTITFEDHAFRYSNGDGPGDHTVSGTFRCDAVPTPNEITFVFGEHTVAGCYALSGDDLQICVGPDDAAPPKVLAGGPGERPALLVFRRLKADEAH